jgi:hypothetical protein
LAGSPPCSTLEALGPHEEIMRGNAVTADGDLHTKLRKVMGEPMLPGCSRRPTTMSASFVAEVHDRMPAILAEKDFEIELLQPAPVEIVWMVLFLGTGTGIIEWARRKS